MIDFEWGPAVGAGLVGGGVMAGLLYAGIGMMPDKMRMNLLLMLGTMTGLSGPAAYTAGLMMHLMASAAFGAIHAAIFAAADITDGELWWGALFGLGHAVISGSMLAGVPMMHPEMKAGRMEAPGPMALALGAPTAMGFVALHIAFGALVGVLYAAWI
ncbi:MAG: hypothetical protein ACE5EF_01155 [Dehalococcoidia bacterium]